MCTLQWVIRKSEIGPERTPLSEEERIIAEKGGKTAAARRKTPQRAPQLKHNQTPSRTARPDPKKLPGLEDLVQAQKGEKERSEGKEETRVGSVK